MTISVSEARTLTEAISASLAELPASETEALLARARSLDSTVVDLYVPPPSVDLDVYSVCHELEQWAAETTDIGALNENKSKLSAIDHYLAQTSIDGRRQVAATMRRLEVRIGEVLGAPKPGERNDINPSVATEGSLTRHERNEFREMAAHPEVVERVIAESTDEQPASRRQVTAAIKNETPEPGPRRSPLSDQASNVGWRLRKSVESAERIFADDRFASNKQQVASRMAGHLSYTVEVCQDLLARLNPEVES